MDDEISISVTLPLDGDGFLRRECPSCGQEFKLFANHEPDHVNPADQYYCPLCGVAADSDSWWTEEQLEYARSVAAPELNRRAHDIIEQAFKGIKGVKYKRGSGDIFVDAAADPPIEPDDMVIVEPPCHTSQLLKVPENAGNSLHCSMCGAKFAI